MDKAGASRTDVRAPLAAFFSFVLPGLGQAYNRQYRLALLLLTPAALIGWLVLAAVGRGTEVAVQLLDTRILAAIVLLNLGLLGWRLVAIYQAHAAREAPRLKRWTTWVTAGLLAVTVGMHLVPAWVATATIDTLRTPCPWAGAEETACSAPRTWSSSKGPGRTAPPTPVGRYACAHPGGPHAASSPSCWWASTPVRDAIPTARTR